MALSAPHLSVTWAAVVAVAGLLAAAALLRVSLGVHVRWDERPARREGIVEWRCGPLGGTAPLPLPKDLPLRLDSLDATVRDVRRWVQDLRAHVPELLAMGVAFGGARLETLALRVQVGTGDAAQTAIAYGLVHAALWPALVASARAWRYRGQPDVAIWPDFSPWPSWSFEAHCIWSWRLGHLIAALGRIALGQVARAVARWAKRIVLEVRPS